MVDFYYQSTPKTQHGRLSKKCLVKISPEKRTLSANFTEKRKAFDIIVPEKYIKMRRDLSNIGPRKTDTNILGPMLDEFDGHRVLPSDNPTYEDPRDVIAEKPVKPPRRRLGQNPVLSPRSVSKEGKSLLREQKRKLTKKYESLIVTLMDRCEENIGLINEKEHQLQKLKDKLKSVLEFNKLFAEENDQLKDQHAVMVKYIDECKQVIQELETRSRELELSNKELGERVRKYEVPDRDVSEPSTAVPLVEVCMSCSSRQILLTQVRDHNARLQADMQALKDVLYRLNVQLAKYQERLRNNTKTLASEKNEQSVHQPRSEAFDSLITSSLGYKPDAAISEECSNKSGRNTPTQGHPVKVVDLSGLLSAQAIAPLFDAYQENIQEKEILILDYEKQFENINKKSKQLLSENKSLQEKVASLEEELIVLSKGEKKLALERETLEVERQTLIERAEKAEMKLKEVYELYEDKMAAMMRDYETVHREYYAVKNALAISESKMARLDATMRDRTVPADLHERRVDHCKRLLDELKHQYTMEAEKKAEQMAKLQEQKNVLEDKYNSLCKDHENVKEELKEALKNVRLYRKAAVVFRQRLRSTTASMLTLRRGSRRRARCDPLRAALAKLEAIKDEIKTVKSRAYTSLEELERRIVQQERKAARAEEEYRRELERAHLVLEHKEGIIRSLIDKVADVEEVRLSQTNAHRLQGIVSDSSPETKPKAEENRRDDREGRRLAPTHGGYYQERRERSGTSRSRDRS